MGWLKTPLRCALAADPSPAPTAIDQARWAWKLLPQRKRPQRRPNRRQRRRRWAMVGVRWKLGSGNQLFFFFLWKLLRCCFFVGMVIKRILKGICFLVHGGPFFIGYFEPPCPSTRPLQWLRTPIWRPCRPNKLRRPSLDSAVVHLDCPGNLALSLLSSLKMPPNKSRINPFKEVVGS